MTGFDTNVLIYACDKTDPRKRRIALDQIHSTTDGVVLWQVACEFIAVSRKLSEQGFLPADAWIRLSELLKFFPLVIPTPAVLGRARALYLEQQWSFWDAMIVGACLDAGVTRLYSEDLPGRPAPQPLQIINPFA
jgi:predicted nucleic acid-binding protein